MISSLDLHPKNRSILLQSCIRSTIPWKAIWNPRQQQVRACGWNEHSELGVHITRPGHDSVVMMASLNRGIVELPSCTTSHKMHYSEEDEDADVEMKNSIITHTHLSHNTYKNNNNNNNNTDHTNNNRNGKGSMISHEKSSGGSHDLEGFARVKFISGYFGYCLLVTENGQVYVRGENPNAMLVLKNHDDCFLRQVEKWTPLKFCEYDREEETWIEVYPTISRIECSPSHVLLLDSNSGRVYASGLLAIEAIFGERLYFCEMIQYFVNRKEKVTHIACSENGYWFVTHDLYGTQRFYTGGDTIDTFGFERGIPLHENEFPKSSKIVEIQRRYGMGILLLQDGRLFGVSHFGQRKFIEMNRSKICENEMINKIMIGHNFIIALISQGVYEPISRVLLWGDLVHSNTNSALNLGTIPTELYLQSQPINEYITDVSCGLAHIMLTSSQRWVYSMGSNVQGQLGNGTPFDSYEQPTRTDLSLQENEIISNIYCYQFYSFVVIEKINTRLVDFFGNLQRAPQTQAFSDLKLSKF
ncbi:hypothetical protein FDP41_004096 [Naegleria fowleri]|uniref:Uncharacterized protein n=1 Tax=Naegleria fowleri TaxID=5763 RepID=A0A6A5BRA3_NAEFO|nr:uncharacterized protein FDP41_004096 [Naegleria fowleri]KAF0976801.1 hypothetical protein FDP41_004096 [Naegleria fowleri]